MSAQEGTAAFPEWLAAQWSQLPQAGAGERDRLQDADRLAAVEELAADDVDHVQALAGDLVAGAAERVGAPIGLLNVVLSGSQVIAGAHGLTGWLAEARATPQVLGDHLKAEVARWTPIIKAAGVYAD